ncbi:MAG: glycosyltransferase [Turicibacter sp.]
MSKYRMCVYAICKDEEKFVDSWMDSMSEADLVVVMDTGSSDKTVERLKERGAIVYKNEIVPWRFDVARNKSLEFVPDDVEICICTDLDEVFEPGWREHLESQWKQESHRGIYTYNWSLNNDGTPKIQFKREKIHNRKDYVWIHPVHEVLHFIGDGVENVVELSDIVLNHYPDLSKSRGQYLSLLELSASENPNDHQTVFWLGREYLYYQNYDMCIETLKKHLQLKSAIYIEERSAAMRFIADSYKLKGNFSEAKSWLFKAIAECPNVREPYFYMARLGYEQEDWILVYWMCTKGLEIIEKGDSYLLEPQCWGYILYDYAAISGYQLGLYKESYEYALKASILEPNNRRLKENLSLIRLKLDEK